MADSNETIPNVTLCVGGEQFSCRRKDLVRCSPYFEAMFSHNFIEKNKNLIDIKGVDPEAMSVLLQFAINNEVTSEIINSNNILSVLQASSMLQFENLKQICVRLITKEWLNNETCLQTLKIAYELDIIELYNKSKALALWEFSEVKLTSEFSELSVELLEAYLSDDGLNITQGEFEVFEAAVNWLQEKTERLCHAFKVLKCVRFRELSISDIKTMTLYPQMADCIDLLNYIIHLREHHFVPLATVAEIGAEQTEEPCADTKININSRDTKTSIDFLTVANRTCLVCRNFCCCLTEAAEGDAGIKISEDVDENSKLVCSKEEENCAFTFDSKELKTNMKDVAVQLLCMSARKLPLVPCVIGHRTTVQLNTNTVKRTYLIYFEEKKLRRPIPFLHLSKVNESMYEPVGYQVLNRGRELYIIGGEYLMGYGNWNNSVWKYDIIKEEWTYETSLLAPRRHHAVCCINDEIFVIGGFGRHRVIMSSVIKYNIITRKWIHCSSLPQNMYSVTCCNYKGYIFVFGLEVYIYHIETDMWHTFKEPPITNNMAFNSAMVYKDSIYLTGSYSPELIKFSPHISSSSQTDAEHKTVGVFNYQPSGACLVHSRIYSFSADEEGHMFIEVYDIEKEEFQVVWEGIENEEDGITDFNAKSHVGCFPMCLY